MGTPRTHCLHTASILFRSVHRHRARVDDAGWHRAAAAGLLDVLEVCTSRLFTELKLRLNESQLAMRRAYESHGIPRSTGKAIEREVSAQSLGVRVAGHEGWFLGPASVVCRTALLTLWLCSGVPCQGREFQVTAGRWVRLMTLRRPTMSAFQHVWRALSSGGGNRPVNDRVRDELWTSVCLSPLMVIDTRIPVFLIRNGQRRIS